MNMIMKKHAGHLDGYAYLPLDDYFKTNDFPLVVTLVCKGFSLATLDRDDTSKKYKFFFDMSKGLKEVVDKYWLHMVSVEPLEYENTRKNLKARMYSFVRY